MRWLVIGCKYDFVVCFYSLLLFCIYIAEEHTRHVSMCFTVAVECVPPLHEKHAMPHACSHPRRHGHTNTGNRVT